MTLKELSQLYYLNREIEVNQQRLADLRDKAESVGSPSISDMPKTQGPKNRIEQYVTAMADIEAIIEEKQAQCIQERERLERYIAGISDSQLRLIFELRFIDGMRWEEVAMKISERLSGKYVSNLCYAQIKKDEKCGEI